MLCERKLRPDINNASFAGKLINDAPKTTKKFNVLRLAYTHARQDYDNWLTQRSTRTWTNYCMDLGWCFIYKARQKSISSKPNQLN